MNDSLQYAFLQYASHLEKIIAKDYKEIISWAEYRIRKMLEIADGQPMPIGWKKNIPFYLKGYNQTKFFEKMDRIKDLQLILRNLYTIYRNYDTQNKLLKEQNQKLQNCLDGNMTTINLFGEMLNKELINKSHQLI